MIRSRSERDLRNRRGSKSASFLFSTAAPSTLAPLPLPLRVRVYACTRVRAYAPTATATTEEELPATPTLLHTYCAKTPKRQTPYPTSVLPPCHSRYPHFSNFHLFESYLFLPTYLPTHNFFLFIFLFLFSYSSRSKNTSNFFMVVFLRVIYTIVEFDTRQK